MQYMSGVHIQILWTFEHLVKKAMCRLYYMCRLTAFNLLIEFIL